MGTAFSFYFRGGDPVAVQTAVREAVAELHRVNEVFSTYRDESQGESEGSEQLAASHRRIPLCEW